MVFDQFISSLIPNLSIFINEREVLSLQKAVQLADDALNSYPRPSHSIFGVKRP